MGLRGATVARQVCGEVSGESFLHTDLVVGVTAVFGIACSDLDKILVLSRLFVSQRIDKRQLMPLRPPSKIAAMKALLPIGIVLVVLGVCAGFLPQIIATLNTGVPGSGIPWLQTSGFIIAVVGAIFIGVSIGKRLARRRRSNTPSS